MASNIEIIGTVKTRPEKKKRSKYIYKIWIVLMKWLDKNWTCFTHQHACSWCNYLAFSIIYKFSYKRFVHTTHPTSACAVRIYLCDSSISCPPDRLRLYFTRVFRYLVGVLFFISRYQQIVGAPRGLFTLHIARRVPSTFHNKKRVTMYLIVYVLCIIRIVYKTERTVVCASVCVYSNNNIVYVTNDRLIGNWF